MLRRAALRALEIVFVLLAVHARSFSQTTPNITEQSKNSTCSNIVALAGNVDLKCSSLTPAQQKIIEGIPGVLNKILSNQLDINLVMAKLDELLSETKNIKQGVDEIRRKQEGRRLSEEQKEILKLAIPKQFGKSGESPITAIMGDPESITLAMDFVDVFQRAGWTFTGGGFNQAVYNGLPRGVIIRLRSKDDNVIPSLTNIFEALHQWGLNPSGEIDPKIPSGEFQIVIGAQL
jgi:hypothetical protein